MKKKFIIYGATVTAAAIASVLKSDCIVINHGYNCGFEYAESYKTSTIKQKSSFNSETNSFIQDMQGRNILYNEHIHPLALAGLMAKYFLKSNTTVYFGSTLESVIKTDSKITATFYLNGEKVEVCGDIFIDTTDFGVYDKYLCAALHTDKVSPCIPCNDLNLKKGRFENEYYLQLKVDENETYTQATNKLNELWISKYQKELEDFKIASIAGEYATYYKNPVCVEENFTIHIPSASFKNAAESFDAGLKFAEKYTL